MTTILPSIPVGSCDVIRPLPPPARDTGSVVPALKLHLAYNLVPSIEYSRNDGRGL